MLIIYSYWLYPDYAGRIVRCMCSILLCGFWEKKDLEYITFYAIFQYPMYVL